MWRVVMFVIVTVSTLSLLNVVSSNANLRTLRTFQSGACDGDILTVECGFNTVISVTKALYGVLPPTDDVVYCPESVETDTSQCVLKEPLAAVEDSCKDKAECSFKVSPSVLEGDPCPGVRKYAQIFYKCRPSNFYTKIVCEGDTLRLRCRKTLRIVVYSAWFGSTSSGVPECPLQRRHRSEDCQSEYATETVVNLCHGRLKCSLPANSTTFGKPGCTKKAHLYLKVVYTCVSKEILQDLELDQENIIPDFSPAFPDDTQLSNEHREDGEDYLQLSTLVYRSDDLLDLGVTTTKEVDILSDENANDYSTEVNCTVEKEKKVVGFITEWISAYKFMRDNKEKFILYVTVSLGAGLLAFLILLATKLYIQQRRQMKNAKLSISDPLPLTVDEDCSDVENYDPRHDRAVEVVRYTNTSTVRRQDSNSGPRAPLSHNNYYYS